MRCRVRSAEEAADRGGAAPRAKRKRKALPTEDEFMRLDDMEAFVRQAEQAAMQDDDEDEGAESGAASSCPAVCLEFRWKSVRTGMASPGSNAARLNACASSGNRMSVRAEFPVQGGGGLLSHLRMLLNSVRRQLCQG